MASDLVSPRTNVHVLTAAIGLFGQSGAHIARLTASRLVPPSSTQPSACSLTSLSVTSDSPPIQIGGRGCWYVAGWNGRLVVRKYLPVNVVVWGAGLAHNCLMSVTDSYAAALRSS